MSFHKTLLYNTLGLPAYWKACRAARASMEVEEVKIAYGKHRRQYAIVLRSKDTKAGRYAFYFHGGAWTFGRPESFVPAAIPWLKLGFTVILPSYRRPPQVGLNGVVADCRAAISALLPSEPVTHLHVGGISAGAHLSALLTLNTAWWQEAGWANGPQKALLCAGPLSLQLLSPQMLFGRYAHLDPYRLLNAESPEVVWQLLHGTNDAVVAAAHSEAFAEKLKALGQRAELLTIAQGTHLDSGRWMFGGPEAQVIQRFLGAARRCSEMP